jgi:tRNA guanosine-2'-O-methyltransferase
MFAWSKFHLRMRSKCRYNANHTTGSVVTESQYARFCTVYETIVIGRYLNQALECVQDLDHLASAETIVQKSWLFALLESALSPVTQDSMRKMLGNWLMSTDIKLFSHAEEFATLLQKSFLPWATQGPLFTGSVQGKTRDMRCAHGTRLANFLGRLLQAHLSRDDTYSRRCIVTAVLTYLDTNKNKIVPVAVIYLLQGLVKGLQGESTACMEGEALELIFSMSRITGYPEVARDAMLVQCYKLSQLVSQDAETYEEHGTERLTASDAKLEVLSKQIEAFKINAPSRSETDESDHTRWQSLDDFLNELDISSHTSVQGAGLMMACESLVSILDKTGVASLDARKLDRACDAIWNEVERQDYPRNVIMFLPSLTLHPGCVSRCLEDESLCDTILEIFTQLQRLMKGRIYLWTPIMKAYRTAMISCPAAVEKFGLEEFVIQTANNLPAARLEFKLEAAAIQLLTEDGDIHRSYSDYYGEYEEIGHAAFFDLVNRLSNIDSSMVSEIYDRLLAPWTKQRPPVPIVTRWKTTTQLQVLLMLSEQRLQIVSANDAEEQLRVLLRVVAIEPLPRYRFLLEWMIARVILNHPSTGELVLDALSSKDHHSNPKYLGTLVKIALMIACQDNCSRDFAARVAYRLVALASSAKIIIRHEAQWSFPILWDYADSRGWTEIQSNLACAALNDYIRSLERFSEPPPARELERLDPSADNTLTNLLQGKYLRVEPPGEKAVVAGDFQRLWDNDTLTKSTSEALPLGTQPSTSTTNSTLPVQATQEQSKESARTEAFAALQTKGTAYLSTDLSSSDSSSTTITRPTSLIVVGSLVDNAYNLGGLSRISEIFGAEAMYIQSPQSVLGNKDFISVAVASQNHLPIHDLHSDNLSAFLTEKKMQGYTVVGVEQTDRSVILGSEQCKLPEKTLLVMGREKEGVPANVLGECDMLVEIPQRGVTRSMNVQTACGVVLFEYARQHQA